MRNLTVTFRWKDTGRPSNRAGSYFHCRSAAMAASCRRVGPEITFTSVTLPAGSTTASMLTSPATWFDLASAGYVGGTDLIRRATWTSPPTTGLPATGTGIGRFVTMPEIGVSSEAGDAYFWHCYKSPDTGSGCREPGIGRFVTMPEIGVSSEAGTSPGSAGAASDGVFAAKSFASALLALGATSAN